MAQYGSGGYSTYGTTEPQAYRWNKPAYETDYSRYPGYADRARRPDFEGRRRPPVTFAPPPPSTYVTQTETVIEQVETRAPPPISEYKYGVPRAEPLRTFGDGYKHSGSPAYGQRPPQVEEFVTKIQTEVAPPIQNGPTAYWDGGRERDKGWDRDREYGAPGSRDNHKGYGHGDYKDNGRSQWEGPKRDRDRDGYYNGHGRTSSSPTGNGYGNGLSRATNDIGEAIEYLKDAAEVARPPSGVGAASRPKFRVSVPAVPRSY